MEKSVFMSETFLWEIYTNQMKNLLGEIPNENEEKFLKFMSENNIDENGPCCGPMDIIKIIKKCYKIKQKKFEEMTRIILDIHYNYTCEVTNEIKRYLKNKYNK